MFRVIINVIFIYLLSGNEETCSRLFPDWQLTDPAHSRWRTVVGGTSASKGTGAFTCEFAERSVAVNAWLRFRSLSSPFWGWSARRRGATWAGNKTSACLFNRHGVHTFCHRVLALHWHCYYRYISTLWMVGWRQTLRAMILKTILSNQMD